MKKTELKYFGLYRAAINLLLVISIILFILIPVTVFIPLKFDNVAAKFYSKNIELAISGKYGSENIVTLSMVVPETPTKKMEGNTELRSKHGEIYKAYYSPKFKKLSINVSEEFAMKMKLFFCLVALIVYATFIIFLYIIRRILYSLENGTPFIMYNAENVRKIAIVLFCVPVFNHIMNFCLEYFIESSFNLWFISERALTPLDMLCILGGVIMAILSYVFKQGVRMKEEQDLTI